MVLKSNSIVKVIYNKSYRDEYINIWNNEVCTYIYFR